MPRYAGSSYAPTGALVVAIVGPDGDREERARDRAGRAVRRRDRQLRFDRRLSRVRHRHRQGAGRRAARHPASHGRRRRSDRGVLGGAVCARGRRRSIRDITRAAGCRFSSAAPGFYYRALTRGLFDGPGRDEALRRPARAGRGAARAPLRCIAGWRASIRRRRRASRPRDVKRLVRALEVWFLTGRPLTDAFRRDRVAAARVRRDRRWRCGSRETTRRERVARRVDAQFAQGLLDEMRGLLAQRRPGDGAARSAGLVYRQALEHLHGVRDEAETRALIVRENRRYARRQLIWFRKEPNLRWIRRPRRVAVDDAAIAVARAFYRRSLRTVTHPRSRHPHRARQRRHRRAARRRRVRRSGQRHARQHLARGCRSQLPTLRSLGLPRVAHVHGMAPVDRRSARSAAWRSVAGQGLGHRPLGDDGIVLDRAVSDVSDGFPAELIDGVRAPHRPRARSATRPRPARRSSTSSAPSTCAPGCPIVYTSADSVFQIAAHEDVIPVPELYRICEIAYELVGEGLGVGRVIARPFVGAPGSVHADREPPRLRAAAVRARRCSIALTAAGQPVVAIGKIEDLFAGRGITAAVHTRERRRRRWTRSSGRCRHAAAG